MRGRVCISLEADLQLYKNLAYAVHWTIWLICDKIKYLRKAVRKAMVAIDSAEVLTKLIKNIEQVVIGKPEAVKLAVIALLCNGNLLIEDVPGVAKTILARSLACSVGGKFSRIQFTPDLLPSDVTGISIYNQKSRDFEFLQGPIFANIVLADEINRATPKTQSALLEAMGERQVTVEGKTHQLEEPFLVIATQNPIEYEGTFPLPEAQLDRFLLRITIGYPDRWSEKEILKKQKQTRHPVLDLQPVVRLEDIRFLQNKLEAVHVEDMILNYIVDIVSYTRSEHGHTMGIELGVSPRGSLALERASRAYAMIEGRDHVLPKDVKALAPFVLAHRTIPRPEYRHGPTLLGKTMSLIDDILKEVPEPGRKKL